MTDLQTLLAASAALHSHLCPRQALGARLGLAAGACLNLDLPRDDKRLLVIVETDGCFVDGLAIAAGVSVGKRTLRIEDYGKTAATFVDTADGRSLRLAPTLDIRQAARRYYPPEMDDYNGQLHAYQVMPDAELFTVTPVHLATPLELILSQPGLRVQCQRCGEDILNQREVQRDGTCQCRACAGEAYYHTD